VKKNNWLAAKEEEESEAAMKGKASKVMSVVKRNGSMAWRHQWRNEEEKEEEGRMKWRKWKANISISG